MASTGEMLLGTTALIVNTFVLIALAFLQLVILGPIFKWAGEFFTTTPAIPMWEISYIPMAIFAIDLIYEIVLVISFVVIAGRRNTVEDQFS